MSEKRAYQSIIRGSIPVTIVSKDPNIQGAQQVREIFDVRYYFGTKEEIEADIQPLKDMFVTSSSCETRIHPIDRDHLMSVMEMYKDWIIKHKNATYDDAEIAVKNCQNQLTHIMSILKNIDE